jgi:hypothetical protein
MIKKDNPIQNYKIPERNQEEKAPPILRSEVRAAIKEAKNGKCPGEDGIFNEYLKLGS